jgi:putative cardiolipin synthase
MQHHTAQRILFALLLELICLAATGRGDVLRILNDHQAAAQARVDLIQQAQFQIDAAYFGVGNDHLACAFLALLRDASERGVKVRLIIDALNNRIPVTLQAYLIKEGIEIREFHPVQICRPLEVNQRMHDKVLIADASQMIVGGRNLDSRNFGLAKRNYVDCDVYVRGEAALQANGYFQNLWCSNEVRPT